MNGSPAWRRLGWCAVVGVVIAGGMVTGGVPIWRSVVVGSASAALLWAVVMSSMITAPTWPSLLPATLRFRSTGGWQLPGLEAARHSPEAFADHLRPRLWTDAQQLLARRGIPPDSPRAVELIGRREYAVITGADTDPRHIIASLPALCDAIARLAVVPEPGSAPAIYHPALMGMASRVGRPPTKSDRKEHHA